MKSLLRHLHPAANCPPSALSLGNEKRLRLVAGHYTRDRVAAFLYYAHCRPVPDRVPVSRTA